MFRSEQAQRFPGNSSYQGHPEVDPEVNSLRNDTLGTLIETGEPGNPHVVADRISYREATQRVMAETARDERDADVGQLRMGRMPGLAFGVWVWPDPNRAPKLWARYVWLPNRPEGHGKRWSN
jgi:hypothetical protein